MKTSTARYRSLSGLDVDEADGTGTVSDSDCEWTSHGDVLTIVIDPGSYSSISFFVVGDQREFAHAEQQIRRAVLFYTERVTEAGLYCDNVLTIELTTRQTALYNRKATNAGEV